LPGGRSYRGGVSKETAGPKAGHGDHSHPEVAGADASVEDVLAVMREHGGRVTSSRRILLSTLFATRDHRTAEELTAAVQAQLPDVHPSTIYRNLDELERLGVVVHSHIGHGPATYHLAASAHGHLVCEVCGATIDVADTMFSGLARDAKADYGFTIDPHHFAVPGRCANCE
jgi:Fur family transcriptional regulator, ferric uptake regulator